MITHTRLSEIKLNEKELYHKQLYSNKFRNTEETKISWQNTNSLNWSKNGNFKQRDYTEEDRNITTPLFSHLGFPGGSGVKNPPVTRWEDPLEQEMATHSSIPAWRIPWTEEPGGLQSTARQRAGHDWVSEHTHSTHTTFHVFH